MNVLILTSAMTEKDFASYQNDAKIKPNPSNQNFYSKLIRCISTRNNVSVVSHRPLSKRMFKQKSFSAFYFSEDYKHIAVITSSNVCIYTFPLFHK